METLKNLLIDSLNGFSPKFIPLMILQLLVAGGLAYLFQLLYNKKFKHVLVENAALWATVVALIVGIAKFSLPYSIFAAAFLIFVAIKSKLETNLHVLGFAMVLLIGIGCGVGSIVQTAIGTAMLILLLLFIPLKENE